jgi:hypothetical protein
MVKLLEDVNLAICPLCVRGMLKSIEYLLQCVHHFGRLLLYLPYMAIGTTTHLLYQVETLQQM